MKNLVVHLSEVQNMFQQESIFYRLKEFGEFTVSWSKWRNILFLIRPNFRLFLATKRSTVIVNENLSLFTSFNWISNPTSNPEPQLELSVVPDFRHDYDDIFFLRSNAKVKGEY